MESDPPFSHFTMSKKLNKLVREQRRAKERLLNTFPTASRVEIVEANTPPLQSESLTRTSKGLMKVLPHVKESMWRTQAEGREKQIMPHRAKTIKLKQEWWDSKTLSDFFRANSIHAEKDTAGWFITMNNPSRKLTAKDQLEIMLQEFETEHLVHINPTHQHLVIESLE